MANKGISELDALTTLSDSNLIEMSEQINGTWKGKKVTWGVLKQDAQSGGGTSYTDVTGTLSAGSTSITLSDESITTISTLDFYTDVYGVNPTAVSVSTGSVTLTFEAQSNAVSVKVRVW